MPIGSLNIAGGQNRINDGGIKNYTGYVGSRFGTNDKLGIVLGGNYYQNDRGSQNFEQGWCVETACKGVAAAQRARCADAARAARLLAGAAHAQRRQRHARLQASTTTTRSS